MTEGEKRVILKSKGADDMIKWISLLTVAALLMAFCSCHAAPAESLTPLEELYREQETLAQPVLEEYERRLEEAINGELTAVRVSGVTVTEQVLIERLLKLLQTLEVQMSRDADNAMFGEPDIVFGTGGAFSVTFVYEDKEVYLGNWENDRLYLRYPAYPDAPYHYKVTNLTTTISEEKTALEKTMGLREFG